MAAGRIGDAIGGRATNSQDLAYPGYQPVKSVGEIQSHILNIARKSKHLPHLSEFDLIFTQVNKALSEKISVQRPELRILVTCRCLAAKKRKPGPFVQFGCLYQWNCGISGALTRKSANARLSRKCSNQRQYGIQQVIGRWWLGWSAWRGGNHEEVMLRFRHERSRMNAVSSGEAPWD